MPFTWSVGDGRDVQVRRRKEIYLISSYKDAGNGATCIIFIFNFTKVSLKDFISHPLQILIMYEFSSIMSHYFIAERDLRKFASVR